MSVQNMMSSTMLPNQPYYPLPGGIPDPRNFPGNFQPLPGVYAMREQQEYSAEGELIAEIMRLRSQLRDAKEKLNYYENR